MAYPQADDALLEQVILAEDGSTLAACEQART